MWVSWGSLFGCDKCILYWRHYDDWISIKRLQRAPCQPTPASPYQSEINTKLWKKGDYPKGPVDVLRRRLFHRNDNFAPPAQWTPTCGQVKTDFRRKTGGSRIIPRRQNKGNFGGVVAANSLFPGNGGNFVQNRRTMLLRIKKTRKVLFEPLCYVSFVCKRCIV